MPIQSHDVLAFDLKSARSYDADGRLHVSLSNISKANVCPYYGEEIPDFEQLGLQAGKVYQLYRDPLELEKGAPTCNGIQLLSNHVAVSADQPQKKVVAGTTGTDAVFDAPYLKNSLVIWDAEDIRNIENNSVRELSCGYRYTPDMQAGAAAGVAYDGVMRNIVFNHVALVREGRAGNDVVVADSSINSDNSDKEQVMSKSTTKLSHAAAMVQGALTVCLQPMLAKDQKVDVKPLVNGIDKKNWAEKKAKLADDVKAALKGKLSKDADLAGVLKMIDSLGSEELPDDDLGQDDDADADGGDGGAMDGDELLDKIIAAVKSCLSAKPAAQDEPPDAAGAAGAATNDPKGGANQAALPDADGSGEAKIDKAAMDAAIKSAVKDTETKTIARMNAIAEARDVVKAYVGKLAGAMDSAETVYKAALDIMKVDIKDVHPSAYRAVLLAQPKKDEGAKKEALAQDSAPPGEASEVFPDLFRV